MRAYWRDADQRLPWFRLREHPRPASSARAKEIARIPCPADVTQFLKSYVDRMVAPAVGTLTHDTPLFWCEWGRRHRGKTRAPMDGKHLAPLQDLRPPDRLSDDESPISGTASR